ncbi:MAG: acyltransferase [Bacteroidales bacterium]
MLSEEKPLNQGSSWIVKSDNDKKMTTSSIFHSYTEQEFIRQAIKLFRFQYCHNKIYWEYCNRLKIKAEKVEKLEEIPFLPISFFKTHQVMTTVFKPEIIFSSSGTTGMISSKHYVKTLKIYEDSFIKGFDFFYGNPDQYAFLALLPNYLEREGSSLILMVEKLMNLSCHRHSGFYLYDHQALFAKLQELKSVHVKTILFGVSFALLDFVEAYQLHFPELIVFETGGMKGRRKEMVKEELHQYLKEGFGVAHIHSEYGMCELLSQAYSSGNNLFVTPPWMKFLLRDEKDPLSVTTDAKSGVINVIDFANLYSCSFIATEDLGRRGPDGKIEILGRLDSAEIRGCNLLIM